MRGKIYDGDLVRGRKAVHKRASCIFHFRGLRQSAGTGVDDQGDSGGLRGGVKISDGLLDAVVVDAEVRASEARESGIARVGYAASDRY